MQAEVVPNEILGEGSVSEGIAQRGIVAADEITEALVGEGARNAVDLGVLQDGGHVEAGRLDVIVLHGSAVRP